MTDPAALAMIEALCRENDRLRESLRRIANSSTDCKARSEALHALTEPPSGKASS